jgi:ferredoxin
MRVTIARERCITSGNCVLTAPAVFDQDDEGVVVLNTAEPPAVQTDAVQTAADLCPAHVIEVEN